MEYQRKDKSVIEFTTILENEQQATIFHHFKGNDYKILTIAKDSDTLENIVIYQGQYENNPVWTRKIEDFFSKVDKEKYPEITQEYRFEKVNKM